MNCPHCNADLTGDPIPEKDLELFGGATHFDRKIGVEILGTDMVCYWKCPECGEEWERGTNYD